MSETPSRLHAAIERYERRHREDPNGRFFLPLATAYRRVGELERAEDLLRGGLRNHPEYLSARVDLGLTLAARGAADEARSTFRQVLESDPQNVVALRTLGELAAASGDVEDAGFWYHELLAVDPMSDEARSRLEALEEVVKRPAPNGGDASSERRDDEMGAPAAPPADPVAGTDDAWAEEWDAGEDTGRSQAETDSLASETLAELYARQGFHEEAAEIYRALIRRRGAEPVLLGRLAELERASESAEGEAPPSAPWGPEVGAGVASDTDPPASHADPDPEDDWRSSAGTEAPLAEENEAPPQPVAGSALFAESFRFGFAGQRDPDPEPEAEWEVRNDAWLVPDSEEASPRPLDSVVEADDEKAVEGEPGPSGTVAEAPSIAGYFQQMLAWRPQEPRPPAGREVAGELEGSAGDAVALSASLAPALRRDAPADPLPAQAARPDGDAAEVEAAAADLARADEELRSFQRWLRSFQP
jgi:tetratricopeptide (TPR) repeat protein